jgi:hypothetical protein
MTPHLSTVRARELLNRLAVKEAAWEAEKASRETEVPDPLEAYRAKLVRQRQVTTDEMEARLSELRSELVALIEDAVAAFHDELDALADEAGSETGKLMKQIDKLEKALNDIPKTPRLVKAQ